MSYIVLSRKNRREPWNGLRLVRRLFRSEADALDWARHKARSGALAFRRGPAGWEYCFGARPASLFSREWRPIETALRGNFLSMFEVLCLDGPLGTEGTTFDAEGAFRLPTRPV